MEAAYKTHIGCVRAFNEDSGAVVDLDNGYMMAVVADGMGGHQAGDVASLMAVDIMKLELASLPSGLTPDRGMKILEQTILKANDAIYQYAKSHDDCHGMGTTVAACIVGHEWIVIAHIGDSRVYRVANGAITQLTEDHSLVNELLKNKQISREEALNHPQRNILVRALGTDSQVEVELRALEWEPGEKLLICSDGLSNKVTSDVLLHTLLTSSTSMDAVDTLITLALDAGGEDNISAIVIENQPTPESRNGVSP